jgi:hypothetical protein
MLAPLARPEITIRHVLDCGRVDSRAIDDRVQRLGGHVGRMPPGEFATAAASGGTHRLEDLGFGHAASAFQVFALRRARKAATVGAIGLRKQKIGMWRQAPAPNPSYLGTNVH